MGKEEGRGWTRPVGVWLGPGHWRQSFPGWSHGLWAWWAYLPKWTKSVHMPHCLYCVVLCAVHTNTMSSSLKGIRMSVENRLKFFKMANLGEHLFCFLLHFFSLCQHPSQGSGISLLTLALSLNPHCYLKFIPFFNQLIFWKDYFILINSAPQIS